MSSSFAQLKPASNLAFSSPVSTLAQLVTAFGVGSCCFCCSSLFVRPTHGQGDVLVTCPHCGAEVATDEALTSQALSVHRAA